MSTLSGNYTRENNPAPQHHLATQQARSPVTTTPSNTSSQEIFDAIEAQTEELCHIHDHITRVIANIEIGDDWFSGYDDPERAQYELKPMVKTFLYMYARDFTQIEVERRFNSRAYLWIRFGLEKPISQQTISHNERHRFDYGERLLLKDIAETIHDTCAEHDVIKFSEPTPEPEDLDGPQVGERQIREAVKRATERGFEAFTADRASNKSYPLDAVLERQGYLNLGGQMTKGRRFKRLSPREDVPGRRCHNDTLRKVADPNSELEFQEFDPDDPRPAWKRIRDEVLEPFHIGVGNILDEIGGRDRESIRQPVHGAIDISTIELNKWPFRNPNDIRDGDYPVEWTDNDGVTHRKILKGDYPPTASGLQAKEEWGYKFATLSIIAQDTPIVLAIEPVRDKRKWEPDDLETDTRGDTVRNLIEQASQHVDIQKLFMDAGFDSKQVRHEADRAGIEYILKTRKDSDEDKKNVKETIEDDLIDTKVQHGYLNYEGRDHEVSWIYSKKNAGDRQYTLLITTNGHVSPDRGWALADQYDQRMEIETTYQTLKKNFLPVTASKDFRLRFMFLVVGAMLYNVWRLSNFVLRDDVDDHLGEAPPIGAGEIVELVAMFLFDPGGLIRDLP